VKVAGPMFPTMQVHSAVDWLKRQQSLQKYATTAVMIGVIYYVATTLVAWISAPRIDMTMSPVVGPVAVSAQRAERAAIAQKVKRRFEGPAPVCSS
jgi:hypothetical protein